MLTRRGWSVIGGGMLGLLVGFVTLNPVLLITGVAFLAFALAEVVLLDLSLHGLRPEYFVATRSKAAVHLPVRGLSAVETVVQYHGRHGFWSELVEEVSSDVDIVAGSEALRSWWSPGSEHRLAYVFTIRSRGVHTVGPTRILAHDPLGFAQRSIPLLGTESVIAVPALAGVGPKSLSMQVRNRAQGMRMMRQRGYGTEFRSLRPYTGSDDIRSIAWKRSFPWQWFVREHEQEARVDLMILIDRSQAMGAGLPGATALDAAVDASVAMSALMGRREDRVGLLVFDSRPVVFLPPGRGVIHLQRLSDALSKVSISGSNFDLPAALDLLTKKMRSRCHVLAFTALGGSLDRSHTSILTFTAKGHRLHIFTPELGSFLPEVRNAWARDVLELARRLESDRMRVARVVVGREGVNLFPYDRRGAITKVIGLYTRLRTWSTS